MNHSLDKVPKVLIELWGYKVDTPEHKSRFWAWETLNDLVSENPKLAWSTILEVLELTDSDFVIECMGAGFLENLMCEHGQLTMQLISLELPKNKKLAECMSSVWLRVSDTVLYSKFYSLINMEPPFGDEP